jgi:hypothetical protein
MLLMNRSPSHRYPIATPSPSHRHPLSTPVAKHRSSYRQDFRLYSCAEHATAEGGGRGAAAIVSSGLRVGIPKVHEERRLALGFSPSSRSSRSVLFTSPRPPTHLHIRTDIHTGNATAACWVQGAEGARWGGCAAHFYCLPRG